MICHWAVFEFSRHCFSSRAVARYLSVSGPFLAMIILSFPSPPTGALSVPVVNCRNSLFCSSVNEWTISQNSLGRKHITALVWHEDSGDTVHRSCLRGGPAGRAQHQLRRRNWGPQPCSELRRTRLFRRLRMETAACTFLRKWGSCMGGAHTPHQRRTGRERQAPGTSADVRGQQNSELRLAGGSDCEPRAWTVRVWVHRGRGLTAGGTRGFETRGGTSQAALGHTAQYEDDAAAIATGEGSPER